MKYEDPVLQIIGDLRTVYNGACDEISSLNRVIELQKEHIEDLIRAKDILESRIMDITENLLKDTVNG